jgi:hypothetical protein
VDRIVGAGDVVVAGGGGVDPGDLVALDNRTGEIRWTWRPEAGGGRCLVLDLAGSANTLGIAARCPSRGVLRDTVIGLSTVDGQVRWTWDPKYPDGVVRGDEPSLLAAPGGFLVGYGQFGEKAPAPRTGVVLDAASGTARASHPAPDRLAAVVGGTALYLGDQVRAVDLGTGGTLWTHSAGQLTGARPLAVAGQSGRGYLLLRMANPAGVVAGDAGLLRVVALDLDSGALDVDSAYSLSDPTCTTGGDGRRRCDVRPAGILAGPGVVVVYEQPVRTAPKAWLGGLG